MSSPVLECELGFRAGALLLELSFRLEGRRAVLWGPSGTGKSTVLRLLAGLLRPQRGLVKSFGRTLVCTRTGTWLPAGRRSVGLVTQDPALFPHLDLRANIAFGLAGLPAPERTRRVEEMVELFGLGSLAARRPGELSGGEQRRVALARALAPRPALLLLDEPFAALDAARREETARVLEACLAREGTASLAVTHDLADVFFAEALLRDTGETLAVLVLEGGRIAARGEPGAVLGEARERLLARLLPPEGLARASGASGTSRCGNE